MIEKKSARERESEKKQQLQHMYQRDSRKPQTKIHAAREAECEHKRERETEKNPRGKARYTIILYILSE